MAILNTTDSSFISWKFTEEEELSASILSDLQVKRIQTELCNLAESKLNLKLNPTNINEFIQDEAFISGEIAMLRNLLDVSEAASNLTQELNSPIPEGN